MGKFLQLLLLYPLLECLSRSRKNYSIGSRSIRYRFRMSHFSLGRCPATCRSVRVWGVYPQIWVPCFSSHSFRNVTWEVHNLDCKHVGTLLRDHELNPKISGIMLFYYLLSVVEIDMPWDDSQVDTYGLPFEPDRWRSRYSPDCYQGCDAIEQDRVRGLPILLLTLSDLSLSCTAQWYPSVVGKRLSCNLWLRIL